VNRPRGLHVEYAAGTLGLTEEAPLLAWLLPEGATKQAAYRIESATWDTGRVDAPDSIHVPYAGPALRSRQVVDWRVKVWTDRGESDWSEPASWEMGLLRPDDWQARFVAPAEDAVPPAGHRPAHLLRRTFQIGTDVARARVYATAHGIYELFLNGVRVGDHELTPGFTSYANHLDVQTFDVADLLQPGDNRICAVLSDGWYRGQTGFSRVADSYGRQVALLAQLEVTNPDGATTVIGTDDRWTSATGPILAADLIEGERVDHRLRAEEWRPVRAVDHDLGRLSSSPAPPVRRVEEIAPASVHRLGDRHHVVDLGQNINGWMALDELGPAGTTLRLTHGELLDDRGDVDMTHLAPFDFVTRQPLGAGQVDEVTAAGDAGERFEPRHTTHGFQYVRIEGHPGPLDVADVRGVVVHTDLRRTGWFSCSDERLNALHEAVVWSFRDNACDVPTDCPQRERAAWTGDWQIFAPTAAFLYDVAGFSAKWLRALSDDQWPDGRVPNFVPDPAGVAGQSNEIAAFMTGSAGWGDASVVVPWEMWLAYGDERFLERQFDSMVAWVSFAEARARSGRHATRVARSDEPRPHERFLWDTGFHWGEWCEPGGNPEGIFTTETDVAEVATAYLHRSAWLLAKVATVLGRDAERVRFARLAEDVKAAWQAEFVGADGDVRPASQANLVRALAFELVPDELRRPVSDQLVDLVRAADTHLGTGFLATPHLLPVLADTGHVDVAFELLLQDTPPSWLAMIDAGATTIWENWDGPAGGHDGVGSLNHYSKGAVISFLHRYVAGIRLDPEVPAYRRFRVEPVIGGGITAAEGRLDCPYGRISSAWSVTGGRFELDVTVPPATAAEIVLPDGTHQPALPGSTHYECTTT
jgi:alpha-L-rhamnosidase